MAALRVHLFGRFSADLEGHELSGLAPSRTHELLAYLLLFYEHPHPREALAETLWTDLPAMQSRKCLRQALWQLRAALHEGCPEGSDDLLSGEAEWLGINPCCEVWVDALELERAYSEVSGTPGRNLDANCACRLQSAALVYRGDLLVDCYQDWCIYQRERLQNIYLSVLDKLMGYCETVAEYEQGIDYGSMILRVDHARERTHEWLMRLQYLAGDRTGAIRQYERCASALRAELDVEPAERTTSLYRQICADRLEDPPHLGIEAHRRASDDAVEGAVTWVPAIVDRLSSIRQDIAELEQQIRRES